MQRKDLECKIHGKVSHFKRLDVDSWRCSKCATAAVSKARRKRKSDLVKESGGCCVTCGYDKCQAALHFHHLNPNEKSFNISTQGGQKSYSKMLEEAKKCVLLCANCHAEVEAGVRIIPAGPY